MSLRASISRFLSNPARSMIGVLLCALFSSATFAETLRVGMALPGQNPFFWRDGGGAYKGIYVDTLRRVADDLDVDLEFIPLSQARLRRHFISGEIDIEMGVSLNFEVPPELEQVSFYSRPYGIVNEVIIYSPELSFPVFILKDLENRRVATVRGTSVPENLIREDFANQWQIAQRVHRGWNDVGLMKEVLAIRYQREDNLNYEISLPYNSNPVVFRLHVDKKELLQPMNESIERLEKQGDLERLVCKYLCGTGEVNQ